MEESVVVSKYWWSLALRGFFAVLFGLVALFWPGLTFAVLVFFFGVFALVDGAFAIGSAISAARVHKQWWLFLLEGVVGITVGMVTFFWPNITALMLFYLVVIWALVTGLFELIASFSVAWETADKVILGVAGVLSMVIGVLLLAYPAGGIMAVIWLIGIYALVFGVMLIVLGFKMRSLGKDTFLRVQPQ